MLAKKRQPIAVGVPGYPTTYVRRTTPAQVDAIQAAKALTLGGQLAYVLCDKEGNLLRDPENAEHVASLTDSMDAADMALLLKASRADTPQKDGAVKDPGNSTGASA